jgi:hypothetical protein
MPRPPSKDFYYRAKPGVYSGEEYLKLGILWL